MLKTTLAIGAGKLTSSLVSALHLGEGTSLPGKVARRIDPDVLRVLGRQIQKETIAVSGTNGKTTTCGLLARFLEEAGHSVAHNQLGANMVPGITAALLKQSSISGQLAVDYGVLEVDEASLTGVASEVAISRIAVTNLFRDQLDRYGELDTTARLIEKGINKSKVNDGGCLYLNADDPLVASMGVNADRAVYYAVKNVEYVHPVTTDFPVPFPREVTACPRCGSDLYYQTVIYGHLGHYECMSCCGYDRPTPTVVAEHVLVKPEGSDMTLRFKDETLNLHLPLPGVFNVYNFLAAAAVADDLGLPHSVFESGLKHYHSVFGRAERRTIDGRKVMIFLIKNPVGASEVLKLVGTDPNGRLMIALNDNYADGRDVSWIWDATFENIRTQKPIVVSGVRAADMAVRLKYAGVDENLLQIEPDVHAALCKAVRQTPENETLYVLPTYTALLGLRNL